MYNECRHIFTSGKKCRVPPLKLLAPFEELEWV
jgi:hypothetical protein